MLSSAEPVSRSQRHGTVDINRTVVVESPALKWPDIFDKSSIIVNYPYLLPCAMAASITFTGENAVLSVKLGEIHTIYRLSRIIISGLRCGPTRWCHSLSV